jgi:dCTP diphosphatase
MTSSDARRHGTETDRLDRLRKAILAFTEERDWSQFHDPKNLAMAIGVEAGELMDHFRWTSNEMASSQLEDSTTRSGVEDEVADVLILLIEFAHVCGIDPIEAAERKLACNANRYPVTLSKGRAVKHDRLHRDGRGLPGPTTLERDET